MFEGVLAGMGIHCKSVGDILEGSLVTRQTMPLGRRNRQMLATARQQDKMDTGIIMAPCHIQHTARARGQGYSLDIMVLRVFCVPYD